MLSRNHIHKKLSEIYNDPVALQNKVEETANLPDKVSKWLGRLKLLYGVPINYLVPNEGMLPPESIRFFYLDFNWIDALIDGAFSIGRNLTIDNESISHKLDSAAMSTIKTGAIKASNSIRSRALGLNDPAVSFKTVSGFLLRSTVVKTHPGLGVNPYPLNGTPNDGENEVTLLKILRMERLGPNSDTLICLVEGDISRVDIHEAPELLHYGIDSFEMIDKKLSSQKTIYTFKKSGPKGDARIEMNTDDPIKVNLISNETGNCFRVNNDKRTIKMKTLSTLIGQCQDPTLKSLDASEMGFEMIEGVGMVSFIKSNKI